MNIGLLGGSFNPVHTGHIRLALEVLDRLHLDKVIFVPAAQPPHKSENTILPFADRVCLLELAVQGLARLSVSTVEGERLGPSYTFDTLKYYQSIFPDASLFFIMGAGTFMELHEWQNGLELMLCSNLVCVSRWTSAIEKIHGYVEKYWASAVMEQEGKEPVWLYENGNKLYYLDIPRLDIKGKDIRQKWRKRENISLLVPASVENILEQGGASYEQAWGMRQP